MACCDDTRLITISISHYSEKARWALDHCNVPYEEEVHTLGGHRLATRKLGGKTVPALSSGSCALLDSTPIAMWADANARSLDYYSPPPRILPSDPRQRRTALELEALFSAELGTATRVVIKSCLASVPRVLIDPSLVGPKPCERFLFSCCGLFLRPLIGYSMRVSACEEAQAYATIDRLFALVNELLRCNRYLVGDRLSIADITFASLATPIIMPDEWHLMRQMYAHPDFPLSLKIVVNKYRNTPAGQYVLRLYSEDRYAHLKRF